MDEFQGQLGLAVLIVHLIDALKCSNKFPWINENSARVTRMAAMCCTVLAALGIHSIFNGTLTSGGVLQITLPPVDALVTSATHVAIQWGLQQTYRTVKEVRNQQPAMVGDHNTVIQADIHNTNIEAPKPQA